MEPSATRSSIRHLTTWPATEHRPPTASGGAEMRRPAGTTSVTTTLLAVDGPRLETTRVNTTSPPTSALGVETSWTTPTLLATRRGVVTASALSASSGSWAVVVTEAELPTVPRAPPATVAVSTMVTVSAAPRDPSAHRTAWSRPMAHLPALVATEGRRSTGSSGSVTTTSGAVPGPSLWTVTV
nr:hypothetical protein [Pedococcus dokdonensis]